ncbi:hypothetical protein PC118_g14041 [Phytophthora cactorum]|uniref:Nucleic acid-binding, OB-fold n=1 Tax=Phytophthora cactorum TaxID=29920 RepID=A0A8T1FMA7_9STRA|nr:hypothetical protein PC118_g14041 [Phytophthora cactorum]KAG3009387.1 hypothetical protein PC120_g15668 [Phytophthora cactorum]
MEDIRVDEIRGSFVILLVLRVYLYSHTSAGPEANFRIGDCLDFTILEYRLKNITMTSKVTTTDPELYMQTDTTEH